MKKYEKYKSVDLTWLNEIPSHWESKRISRIFDIRKEKNFPIKTNNILSLSAKYGVSLYSEKKETGGNKSKEDLSSYNLCYPDDILVNCMNVVAGSVGISKYFGAVSPVYYPLVNINKENNYIYYMEYVFRNYNFQRSLVGLGKGIQMSESEDGKLFRVRMRISWDILKTQSIPVPPFEEQKQIAKYLDWKINEIDKLIEKEQNKLILLNKYLKIKVCKIITNSESLNSSWSIDMECFNSVKLSKIASLKNVKASKSLRYIGLENIEQWTGNYKTNTDIYSYADAKLINAGDIGIGLLRPYLAKVFLSNGTYAVSSEICVLNNIKINKKFLKEVLLNIKFIDELNSSTYGTRMPRANWDFLKNMKIPIYPPDIENFKVHKILELKNKINTIEINTKLIIENLNELKNSIISEVVTGKIDVRDVIIPKYEKLNINEVIKEDSFEKGIESDDE